MLDRLKIEQQLQHVRLQKNEISSVDQKKILAEVWKKIVQDHQFALHAQEAEAYFSIPSWQGILNQICAVKPMQQAYAVLGVDGSQIYPDRHQVHVQQALINTGGMGIAYEHDDPVMLFSEPELSALERVDALTGELIVVTADWINFEREAREFEMGLLFAQMMEQKTGKKPILLFDGTLLFLHLLSASITDRTYFFDRYTHALSALQEAGILYASYLSAPRNKDLIHLLKLGLCRFARANCKPCHEAYDQFPCEAVDSFFDRDLMKEVLPLGHRTIFFKTAKNSLLPYSDSMYPYFAYLHSEHEVGRIELPAWIVKDQSLADSVCSVIMDQIKKGHGYPLILAEAHEQAVVKQADKEYFYYVCMQQAIEQNIPLYYSEKSIKKQQMPY
jgi:hypothetical protein